MIKFVYEKERSGKGLVFGDVEEDQLFVSVYGNLCQKVGRDSYNIIADNTGEPCAGHIDDVKLNGRIQRILPRVEKIEF